MTDPSQPESVLVSLTRIEGKIDLANLQLGDVHRTIEDHEKRLRVLQDEAAQDRATVSSDYVSRASARWWFTSLVALIGAVAVVLGLIIRN